MHLTRRQNKLTVLTLCLLAFGLSACAETQFLISSTKRLQNASDDPVVGRYKVGNPYQIQGTWYYPAEEWDYDETGIASWYGPNFHGKDTANGETYDMNDMTAAHRTLPMPSFVRVVNLENGRSIVLRVNDRGPFAKGRIIDVSRRGAQLLGFERQGTARVRVQILSERSQAMKAKIQGQKLIAKEGTPINVGKLPKESVSSTELLPPPGSQSAPQPAPAAQQTTSNAPIQSQQIGAPSAAESSFERNIRGPVQSAPPPEQVSVVPTGPTQIFVQAGAFTNYQNALKTKLSLSRYVPAEISHALVNKKDFYRVRVGPIPSVAEADAALLKISAAGYPNAKVIVSEVN